jgi:hypothetical protein
VTRFKRCDRCQEWRSSGEYRRWLHEAVNQLEPKAMSDELYAYYSVTVNHANVHMLVTGIIS